jgi:pimeloyl-ACP methyl ester carboxylesterase
LSCPALLVVSGAGVVAPDVAARMSRHPTAEVVELDTAAHDLHLDRPAEWRAVLTRFLDALDRRHVRR